MAFVPIRPKFQIEVSQEIQRKIDQSYAETLNMTFRAVRCPYCKTHIVDVFEDVIGHFAVKCPQMQKPRSHQRSVFQTIRLCCKDETNETTGQVTQQYNITHFIASKRSRHSLTAQAPYEGLNRLQYLFCRHAVLFCTHIRFIRCCRCPSPAYSGKETYGRTD